MPDRTQQTIIRTNSCNGGSEIRPFRAPAALTTKGPSLYESAQRKGRAMTTKYTGSLWRGGGKMKKLLAVSATALIASTAMMPLASATPTGPGIGAGKNISVVHNLDFVAAFGYDVGETLSVDVFRNGIQIGHASGPAVDIDEGLPKNGALEVNHGPEGAPAPGDCWEGYTPDIIPGDHVVVTSAGGTVTDEVIVDDISASGPPQLDDVTGDIVLEGNASYVDANGNRTPIEIADLNSGEIRNTSRVRGVPTKVERIPGTLDGWRAIYVPPYNLDRNRDNLDKEGRKNAILTGDHAMGYGHVAPLPSETQLIDGVDEAAGPALGCEQSPKQSNAVTTSDDPAVNIDSGSLNLSGTAMEMVEAVSVTLSDGSATTDPKPVTNLSAGPGEKTWSVEFTRGELEALADGTLTAAGTFTTPNGDIAGRTKSIEKDTFVPAAPTANPPSGTYGSTQSVTLNHSDDDLDAKIRYTLGSAPADPTATSTEFSGQIAVTASQTIKARVFDSAGNMSPVATFAYTIQAATAPNIKGCKGKKGKAKKKCLKKLKNR